MNKYALTTMAFLIAAATSASALVPGDGGCTGPFIPLGGEVLPRAEMQSYPWQPYPGPTSPGPVQAYLPECEMLPNCNQTL